jgi:hypothetical protein
MDPNLFAIDAGRVAEVLLAIIVLSFFVERALALVFEHRLFSRKLARRGLKEPLALLVSFVVCRYWDFDAISVLFVKEHTQFWGHLITAAIVAGGSKASTKLFRDVLGVMSSAERERRKLAEDTTVPAE